MKLGQGSPIMLESPKKEKTIKIVRYKTNLQMKMDTSSSESSKGKKKTKVPKNGNP